MAESDGRVEELVREHGRMLVRLAASRLSSVADAEDVVQDVFCALVAKRPAFSDADHAKAWLVRATINRAADVRRRAARRNVPLDEAALVSNAAAAAERDGLEMLACVRSLPDKYATVLHLHYYESYSLREIAALLGVPAATVGTRLARVRARLQAILKEESL